MHNLSSEHVVACRKHMHYAYSMNGIARSRARLTLAPMMLPRINNTFEEDGEEREGDKERRWRSLEEEKR
jgi:hypothetical protein